MAGVNGFSLEVTANIDGFNRKLAEARKGLEKLQKEATININGTVNASGSGAGGTVSKKATEGLLAMSTATDSATRALARFSAALTGASVKTAGTAAKMSAATTAAGAGSAGKAAASAGILGGLSPYLLAGAAAGVPIYKGLQEFGAREKLRVDLGTLLQSDEKGADMAGRIQRYAASTPYSSNDLSGTAKTLIQYGSSADEAEKLLKQIGDIAMGNGQAMNGLGMVLGQVKSAGVLKGQDLMQFINAGWNPLSTLSQMTGKSIGDLKDAASRGEISFEMVTEALEKATSAGGQFYQGAARGAKTLNGLISTISDNIGTALASIIQSQEPQIKALAESWANFDWGGIISTGSDLFKMAFKGFKLLSDVVQGITGHAELLQQMAMAFTSMAAAAVEYKVIETFTALKVSFNEMQTSAGGLTGALKNFTTSAAGTQVALVGITWGLQQIVRFFSVLGDVFKANDDAKKMVAEIKEREKIMMGLSASYKRWKGGEITDEAYKRSYDSATKLVGDLSGSYFNIWGKPEEEAKKESKGETKNVVVIDKSKKEVKQTNNIKVDESRFMKVVKDNLEMLLTSHFRIDSDLTGMQANAG